MIMIIDNYDSFSYNLYQLIGEIDCDIKVVRNNEITIAQIKEQKPVCIIISPGPGRPEDAGIIVDLAKEIHDIPILGVCLGHQAICMAYGAAITYAKTLMHGKQSQILLSPECILFKGLGGKTVVARYHSLVADENSIPQCLKVTSTTEDGVVMSVEHKQYPIFGVQFHPESIMTPNGKQILRNFIEFAKGERK